MNYVTKFHSQNKKIKVPFILSILILFFLVSTSFNQSRVTKQIFEDRAESIILKWYNLFLKLESKDIYAYPPISANRIAQMGLIGSFIYNEENGGFRRHEDITLLILNRAYADIISGFFDTHMSGYEHIQQLHKSIELSLDHSGSKSEKVKLSSKKIINKVRNLMDQKSDDFCHSDILKTSDMYDHFQFSQPNPVLPEWGLRSMILLNQGDVTFRDPYNGQESFASALHQDALSIYTQSINMSKDDQWIAEFWSDDVRGLTFSPAGRWVAIANQIVQKEALSIHDILNLYLKLGVGLNDAATLCWRYKYKYNLQRPSTFINKHIDPNWKPFHDNPGFPSYPSGHAVLGGVAATILEQYFGSNYHFTDKSHHNRLEFFGKKRSFESIKAMAVENAYSRFVMGVHYKEDCEKGLRLGFDVGDIVKKVELSVLLNRMSQKQKLLSDTDPSLTLEGSTITTSQIN